MRNPVRGQFLNPTLPLEDEGMEIASRMHKGKDYEGTSEGPIAITSFEYFHKGTDRLVTDEEYDRAYAEAWADQREPSFESFKVRQGVWERKPWTDTYDAWDAEMGIAVRRRFPVPTIERPQTKSRSGGFRIARTRRR